MTLTSDQQNSFNEYQRSGAFHPFTCGTKELHAPGGDDVLIALDDGLHCPSCDYRQFWAHAWMLDWSWKKQAAAVWPFGLTKGNDGTQSQS